MDANIYYDPEEFGLKLLYCLDLSEPDYSYDYLAVWESLEHEGEYYIGTDSGCSCPIPFESYAGIQDTTGPLTAAEVITEASSLANQQQWNYTTGEYEPYIYDEPKLNEIVHELLDTTKQDS